MKKIGTFILAAAIAISSFSTVTAAETLDSKETITKCSEYPHIHEEDFVSLSTNDKIAMPRAEIHCTKGSQIGRLIASSKNEEVGHQTRPCTHGRVGGTDYRYQFQTVTTYKCTLCAYNYKSRSNPYWGSWVCG